MTTNYAEHLTTLGHELEHLGLRDLEEVAEILEGLRPEITIKVEESGLRPSQPPPSTQEVIDSYLVYLEDGGAAEGYVKVRARKLRFFARQHPQLPTDPETIHAYLRQFKTYDVSTRRDQWTALTALYKFACRTYRIKNAMLKVDKPRFRKKPGQRLSRDQAKLLVAATRTDLEWALVTCYFGLRFRRSEAERLRFGDIKDDYLVVRGKERIEELPLLPLFRDKLLGLNGGHRPDDPLFPIKGDTMAYHVEKIFRRAGIIGARASPHTLRNTAGALWSTFGGDWTSNRQLLRHSEQTMTDHYSPLSIDELSVKDERHNPMLNLMREMGLAPGPPYPVTTGVQEPETDSQNRDAILTYQVATDPALLLPEILDQMIALGKRAHQVSQALGGNGHRPEQLEEIMHYLKHQASK